MATGTSPAELLMGRRLRTALDGLHPNSKQDTTTQKNINIRIFEAEDSVWARTYLTSQKWIAAWIVKPVGRVTYEICTIDGKS